MFGVELFSQLPPYLFRSMFFLPFVASEFVIFAMNEWRSMQAATETICELSVPCRNFRLRYFFLRRRPFIRDKSHAHLLRNDKNVSLLI